ncbi:bifunctional glycosyltransferase/CDP-glycerol:glycerophosphate glycerophosphotransferase [Nonomuraea dietziae]|uniref:bifunctional glycosyltransferase/CDP-glycerol:glycerophosphate glycerophosphotransferase n=1 Tax=Nonomuraea dietziae TaxID=65515 RepID=UPI003448AEE8
MSAILSIVVPFCNVEHYLDECLESIATQTLSDIEVFLVDDGSTDNSAVIAKARVARDSRFQLIQQENRGPGLARNAGLDRVAGRYLTFADGDDVVPPGAYEALVGSLESTGSDLACGAVRRLSAGKEVPSWLHDKALPPAVQRTHVRHHPQLLRDRTVWNKVYRRSFWESRGFRFPAGIYEDVALAVAAHVHAETVDVLDDVVYLWRRRDRGELSTTQNRAELGNLRARFDALEELRAVVAAHLPELLPGLDTQILEADVMIAVEAVTSMQQDEREAALDRVRPFLTAAGLDLLMALPVADRVKLYLARHRRVDALREVFGLEREGLPTVKGVRKGIFRPKLYLTYPFFGDRKVKVPARLYEVDEELELHTRVDRACWEEGGLVIEGFAYIDRLEMTDPGSSELRLELRNAKTADVIELTSDRAARPDVTARAGHAAVCYDWSGFRARINFGDRLLRRPGNWELWVTVESHGLQRSSRISGPVHGHVDVWLDSDLRMRVPPRTRGQRFQIRMSTPVAVVDRAVAGASGFELSCRIGSRSGGAAEVILSGAGDLSIPVELDAEGAFDVVIPYESLLRDPHGDDPRWEIVVAAGGASSRLASPDGVSARWITPSGAELAVEVTRYGFLAAIWRETRPIVDTLEWDAEGRLVLSGEHVQDARPERLLVCRRRSTETRTVPLEWEGARFHARLAVAELPSQGGELPLASGLWDLLMEVEEGAVPLRVKPTTIGTLSEYRVAGSHDFCVTSQEGEALALRSRVALGPDERGRYAQRLLRERTGSLPLKRDLVLFDSYEGRQFSCNPRAVFEELRRRDVGAELVWVSRDGQFATPEGAEVVMKGSRRHHEVRSSAGLVVSNWSQREIPGKPAGQLYMQTWHGTPLKRLGYDLKVTPFRRAETFKWIKEDVPLWDFLVSPSAFATTIMRRAYDYGGEVLEVGYPRNDLLKAADREERAQAVRRRLGIEPGKKVVLYAPTWRDDQHVGVGKRLFHMELDLERARKALGDDHVFLVRAHYLVTDRPAFPEGNFAIDVTHYPDIAELYLISDVLVTDYSSAMFDYCNTGRPMIFFTYDLATYRDEARGFYFDFEAEAPGPIVEESDQVIEAIAGLRDVEEAFAGKYRSFVDAYCPHDDGRASERVVDRIISTGMFG